MDLPNSGHLIMRLTNYRTDDGLTRVGLVVDDLVVDVVRAIRHFGVVGGDALVSGDTTIGAVLEGAEQLRFVSQAFAELSHDSPAKADLAAMIADLELLPPVQRPSKIVCVGLNYRDHVAELGLKTPERPHAFAKLPTALTGPFAPIVYPQGVADQIDYEAELAVVVGERMRFVSEDAALGGVFGYCVVNDVSARDWQFAPDDQLTLGKGFDTFMPIGPWVVTDDEIPDPQTMAIRCRVNGELRQDSSTADMVFSVAEILSQLSRVCTLEPGDLVATGTPAGVAAGRGAEYFLRPGDVVECEIDRIGTIRNEVILPA